jgi:hypothetical protein
MGEKGKVAIMMVEIFDRVLAKALAVGSHIELRPALEEHFLWRYTWSTRIPGRGVYMGGANEHYDEVERVSAIAFDNPDTFIPENGSDSWMD